MYIGEEKPQLEKDNERLYELLDWAESCVATNQEWEFYITKAKKIDEKHLTAT